MSDFTPEILGFLEDLKKIDPTQIPTKLKTIDRGFIKSILNIDQDIHDENDRDDRFLFAVKFYIRAHNTLIDTIKEHHGVVQNREYDVIYFE